MTGKVEVVFTTDTAAFDGSGFGLEVARLLQEIAKAVEDCEQTGDWQSLHDVNGNRVGCWRCDRA